MCIQKYKEIYGEDEQLDVFHLSYLCGMYEEALTKGQELVKGWYLTDSIVAMLIECILKTSSYREKIDSMLTQEDKVLWNTLKENQLLRMQVIAEYSYIPPLISMYSYIF